METEFQFGKMMMVAWECEGTNAVELVIEMVKMVHFDLTMVKTVNFALCIFCQKDKEKLKHRRTSQVDVSVVAAS